jgi:hypothetical protein
MTTQLPDMSHPLVRDAWSAYIEQTQAAREDYQHALAELGRVQEERTKAADAARGAAIDQAWTDYHDQAAMAWASYSQATAEARQAREIAASAALTGQPII